MKPTRASCAPPTKCSSWSTTWAGRGDGFMTRLLKLAMRLVGAAISFAAVLFAQDARATLIPTTRDEVWQAVNNELRQRGVGAEQLLRLEEIEVPVAVPAAAGRSLFVSMVCWDAELGRAQFQ